MPDDDTPRRYSPLDPEEFEWVMDQEWGRHAPFRPPTASSQSRYTTLVCLLPQDGAWGLDPEVWPEPIITWDPKRRTHTFHPYQVFDYSIRGKPEDYAWFGMAATSFVMRLREDGTLERRDNPLLDLWRAFG